MKKSILKLGKTLSRAQQKDILGGTFFHRRTPYSNIWCKYSCRGTSSSLDAGQAQACYLELPYFVNGHSVCGTSGGGDGIDGHYA